jgi:oxygen-dependent protoporphyrinogen oxidase
LRIWDYLYLALNLVLLAFWLEIEAVSGKRVAVVGAGVSGLAAAYKLKSRGLNVTVFEADGRVGGKLRSVMQNGLIWDEGANTMTEAEPEVGSLLDDLGLREKQQFVSTFCGLA